MHKVTKEDKGKSIMHVFYVVRYVGTCQAKAMFK